MYRNPLDADNSQKYFKSDRTLELYEQALIDFKSCLNEEAMRYEDLKMLLKTIQPTIEKRIDESTKQMLINKKLNTIFQHCFFESLEDGRCVATLMLLVENLFINIVCMKKFILFELGDKEVHIYLENLHMNKFNIDCVHKMANELKLLFAIIQCTPTIEELDFELNKAMRKLITYSIDELNKQKYLFIKNNESIDLSEYVCVA